MAIRSTIVDNQVFLQGDRLALGIGNLGSFGTSINAPEGFFTDTQFGFSNLGIYADLDGFGTGELPDFRDVSIPGDPEERFNVGYRLADGGPATTLTNSTLAGGADIPVISVENLSSGDTLAARWTGLTSDGLRVVQTVSFDADDTYAQVTITYTNTSDATLYDLRYARNIDPDQAPDFDTRNFIFEQSEDSSLVASYVPGEGADGETGTDPFFLFSTDPRATVANYGFTNTDPYAPELNEAPQPEGFTTLNDNAIAIGFDLGNLASGASTTITYYFGLAADLEEVIGSIVPDIIDENSAPVAVDDSGFVTGFGQVLTIDDGFLLSNDTDGDGDALALTAVGNATNGSVSIDANGDVVFTPGAGYSGPATFEYTVSDGQGGTDTGLVTLTVSPSEPPPTQPNGPFTNVADRATFASARAPVDVNGLGGNDTIVGSAFGDAIRGSNGNDNLSGRGGNDTLNGGVGDDTLNGDEGNDNLVGSAGDDRLIGGAGSDTMSGGEGVDRFIFQLSDGAGGFDRISGFQDGTDLIVLRGTSVTDITEGPAGATVSFDNGSSVLLVGIAAGDLTATDFVFQSGATDTFFT